jgi:signal transduction histidine kinase
MRRRRRARHQLTRSRITGTPTVVGVRTLLDLARRSRPGPFDLVLTGVLLALGLVTLVLYRPDEIIDYRDPDWIGVALITATTVPIAFRRAAPLAVAVVLGALSALFLIWDYPAPVSAVVALIAIYSLGAYSPLVRGITGVAVLMAGTYGYLFLTARRYPDTEAFATSDLIFVATAFVGAWAIGRAVRGPRLQAQLLEERADQLERTHEAEVRAALAEERGQIARELHDVVAHHVSVMTVQAAGARRALTRDPDAADVALEAIEATGRSAMTEMRRIVGVLRGPDDARPSDVPTPARLPQPGLADLPALVDDLIDAGLPVSLDVVGEDRQLPLGVDLTAFRIVQEALTNTLKHAQGARAQVVLRYSPDQLVVEVTDDGTARLPRLDGRKLGHGLIGMRERVIMYGGTLATGPRPAGGFVVRAVLPLT